jgi:hypothetical protein
MVYSKDFSVDSFEFWSGAKDTVNDVRAAGKMDELQEVIEEQFSDSVPTATQINDFVWFERGYIYSQLGLDENGKPEEDEA